MIDFIISLFSAFGAYVFVYALSLIFAERFPVSYHAVFPIFAILALSTFTGGVGWAWIIGLNVTSLAAVYFAKRRHFISR